MVLNEEILQLCSNSFLACSIRKVLWQRCGGRPIDRLNAREKWLWLKRASRASVAIEMVSSR